MIGVSASYLDSGTKIICQNVTYTLINRINLTGISVFSSTSNYINLDGKYIFNFTSNASDNDIDLITLNSEKYLFNVTCTSCTYNITIESIPWSSVTVRRDGIVITNWSLVGTTLTINGWSNSENQYEVVEDCIAPVITITYPNAGTEFASSATIVNLTATTDEWATLRWSFSDTTYSSMTPFDSTSGTSHYTLISVSEGNSYTIYVRGSDSLGNINSESTTVSFSVKSSAGSGKPVKEIRPPIEPIEKTPEFNVTPHEQNITILKNTEVQTYAYITSNESELTLSLEIIENTCDLADITYNKTYTLYPNSTIKFFPFKIKINELANYSSCLVKLKLFAGDKEEILTYNFNIMSSPLEVLMYYISNPAEKLFGIAFYQLTFLTIFIILSTTIIIFYIWYIL